MNLNNIILNRSSLKTDPSLTESELRILLGMDKFFITEPDLKINNMSIINDITVYDMSINTEPGVEMPFFLMAPSEAEYINKSKPGLPLSSYPVVLVPHGHNSDGRYGAAGIYRHKDMERQQNRYNHNIGLQFVKRGYIVLCPDSRGAGDRRNPSEQGDELKNLLSSSCCDLNNAFTTLGTSLIAACCWDFQRLTDLVIKNGWGDSNNIGVCGFSGGGLQALFLSALDSRIKCTGTSGYFFKYEDCILETNLCSCNFIQSFFESYTLASLGYLISPRALIIEKGVLDPLNGRNGIKGPRLLAEEVENRYRNLNQISKYFYSEFVGGHSFKGIDIFDFFYKTLCINKKEE